MALLQGGSRNSEQLVRLYTALRRERLARGVPAEDIRITPNRLEDAKTRLISEDVLTSGVWLQLRTKLPTLPEGIEDFLVDAHSIRLPEGFEPNDLWVVDDAFPQFKLGAGTWHWSRNAREQSCTKSQPGPSNAIEDVASRPAALPAPPVPPAAETAIVPVSTAVVPVRHGARPRSLAAHVSDPDGRPEECVLQEMATKLQQCVAAGKLVNSDELVS